MANGPGQLPPDGPGEGVSDDIMTWSPSFAELARRLRGQNAGDGLLPVVVFVSLERTLGLKWAIVGLTAVSVGTLMYRMRRGERVHPMMWVILGIALLRAVAGIVTNSSTVYFAPNIVTGFLTSLGMAVSVVIRRPLLGVMVNALWPMPPVVREDPGIRRTFARLTTMWAVYSAVSTSIQLWLLLSTSASTFLVARTIFNTATTLPLIAVTLRTLRRTVSDGNQLLVQAATT